MTRDVLCSILVATAVPALAAAQDRAVAPGVFRFSLGTPERITPVAVRHYQPATDGMAALPHVDSSPVRVTGVSTPRGFLVTIPLEADEQVYGLGLQLQSFQQRGLKKKLRVNADPAMDSGDSHAPVPFYVTTRGYGVLIDTARYATVYAGNKKKRPAKPGAVTAQDTRQTDRFGLRESSDVIVEIPEARGADVYVFAGPTMKLAVQRYNLFAGGGALPPRWGLGFWYRAQQDFGQDDVLKLAADFHERRIPVDVIGLEPHWQTHAYSASFVWDRNRFPDPRSMIQSLSRDHFHLNLWEHAFTHPSSPIYNTLFPFSGDYEVWGGIVPDFLDPKARAIFADLHEREHIALGVSGYKLDECDNSDFTRNWSFPEISRFPSGADGEQMHSLFGLRYQDTIQGVFDKRGQRTYGLVRSSGALAAPYPYVLYSDLYDHRQFIQGVAQASFTGLLWTPEVRDARDPEELIRRLETVVFSPLAMINAWYLKNPPWTQVNREANNAGKFASDWEAVESKVRGIIELRMQFIPYLHAAFVRYHREGLPPFRALVLDYTEDREARTISNEYLMGDDVLVAPVAVGETTRDVYLPAGEWWDFWTGQRYPGQQHVKLSVPLERIPLFVRDGTVLPLARATLNTEDPASWDLSIRIFGDGARPAALFEDDGSAKPELIQVRLEWNSVARTGRLVRSRPAGQQQYRVTEWNAAR